MSRSVKKSGRIRCGACERVLQDQTARRTPRVGERRHLATLEGVEKGRATYRFGRPRPSRADATGLDREQRDQLGNPEFVCKCGTSYAPPDLANRRAEAEARGEDLYLTAADTARRQR